MSDYAKHHCSNSSHRKPNFSTFPSTYRQACDVRVLLGRKKRRRSVQHPVYKRWSFRISVPSSTPETFAVCSPTESKHQCLHVTSSGFHGKDLSVLTTCLRFFHTRSFFPPDAPFVECCRSDSTNLPVFFFFCFFFPPIFFAEACKRTMHEAKKRA